LISKGRILSLTRLIYIGLEAKALSFVNNVELPADTFQVLKSKTGHYVIFWVAWDILKPSKCWAMHELEQFLPMQARSDADRV